MIWIYSLALLLAQGIAVVLLMQFIDRKSKQETEPSESSLETKSSESVSKTQSEDDAIGPSGFNLNDFKMMVAEVIRPIVEECVEAAMEAKDVQFDESKEITTSSKSRMTPEQEARAFDDYRDIEEKLEKEDNSFTPPNSFASGVDFDTLTKAKVILQSDNPPSTEEHEILLGMHKSIEGTELYARLPENMLEKLYECHRSAEMKKAALLAKEPDDADEVDKIERKAQESNESGKESETSSDKSSGKTSTVGNGNSIWQSFSSTNSKNKNKQ